MAGFRSMAFGNHLVIMTFIALVGCRDESDTSSNDKRDVVFDRETGQYVVVHVESGTTWLACRIGEHWNEEAHRCEGEAKALTWAEAIEACPDGYSLPYDSDYVALMCDYIETNTYSCPGDKYTRCVDCEECKGVFDEFDGTYLTNGYIDEDHSDSYIADKVSLKVSCITSDGYNIEEFFVHCVKDNLNDASVDGEV